MPVNEAQAQTLLQILPQLTPDRQKIAGQMLYDYAAERRAKGEPLFPEHEKRRGQEFDAIRKYYTQPDYGLGSGKAEFEAELGGVTDPDESKARVFNGEYLAFREGTTADKINGGRKGLLQAYAKHDFGYEGPELDDKGFRKLAEDHFKLEDAAANEGVNASIDNNDRLTALAAASKKNPKWSKAERDAFERAYDNMNAKLHDSRSMMTRLIAGLQSGDATAIGEGRDALIDMAPDRRDAVLRALVVQARKAGEAVDKAWIQKMFQAGGRFLGGMTNDTAAIEKAIADVGGSGKVTTGLKSITTPEEARDFVYEQMWVNLSAYARAGSDVYGGADISPRGAALELSPESAALVKRAKERAIREVKISQNLRSLAETADPINSMTAEVFGTSGAALGISAITFGFAAPLMARGYANIKYDEFSLKYPDMPMSQKSLVANIDGGAEAAMDLLGVGVLKKFPSLKKLLSGGITRPLLARFGARAAVTNAAEATIEVAQDRAAPYIQEAIRMLQPEMQAVDWDKETPFLQSYGENFMGMLPLTLLMGGALSWREVGKARAMLSDNQTLGEAGYTEADRHAIIDHAANGRMDEAQKALQEASGRRSLEVAKEFQSEGEKVAAAKQQAERSLEQMGALPVMRRTETGWQLRDGESVVDYATHQEADAARWKVFEERGLSVHQATRDAFTLMERNAESGREFAIEFSPEEMTGERAVETGLASKKAVQARIEEDADFEQAAASVGAMAQEADDALAAHQVLGLSNVEFKEGVMRTTVRLFSGATPLTAVEEKIEGDFGKMIASGKRAWVLAALRDYEAKSGDRLMKETDDAKVTDGALREAWSKLGVGFMVDQSRKGVKGAPESWRGKDFRKFFSDAMRSKMGGVLTAWGAFFRAVWRRAAKIGKLRREGGFSPELEAELARQLGLEQAVQDAQTVQEAGKLRDEIATQLDADNAPFSLARVATGSLTAEGARQSISDKGTKKTGQGDSSSSPPTVNPESRAPSTGALGMSLAPGELDARLAKLFDPFQRTPEIRQRVVMEMKRRLGKFAGEFRDLAEANRGVASIGREAKFREADAAARLEDEAMSKLSRETIDALHSDETLRDVRESPLIREMLVRDPKAIGGWRGRLMTRAEAVKRGLGDQYDGMPEGLPRWMFSGSMSPDQMASELHDNHPGLVRDGHADTLWNAVAEAFNTATKLNEAFAKAQATVRDIQREARQSAKVETEAWKTEALRAAKSKGAERSRMLAAMRSLNAILSALPAEVRGKIGGYVQIAEAATDEKRLSIIEERVAKANDVLEKHLVKELLGDFEKLLDKASPTGGGGDKLKGKIGVEGHRWFVMVEAATKMTDADVDGRLAAIQAELAGEIDPETIEARGAANEDEYRDLLEEEQGILMAYGDLKNKSASEMDSALRDAKKVYMEGRLEWTQELLRRREIRAAIQETAINESHGRPATDPEISDGEKKDLGFTGWVKGFLGEHLTLEQAIGDAAGLNSQTRAWVDEITTEADLRVKDAIISRNEALTEMWRTVFPGSTLERLRKIEELASRKDFEGKRISQLEGVHYSMLWRQEGLREALETHGYGAEFQTALEGWLTPEARAVREFLSEQYEAQYDRINEVYRRKYGVDLPKVDFYAPALFEVHGKESKLTIEDGVTQGALGGLSSLRTRRKHRAKPRQIDAVQAWIHNAHNVEHWIAWAEPMTELRAVFGNIDVRNAIKASAGANVATSIGQRLDDIEWRGAKNAESQTLLAKWMRRSMKALADTALTFKMVTIAKQLPAAYASAAEIGLRNYMKSAARVFRGKGAVSYMDMLRSDTMQRRMTDLSAEWKISANGFKAEVRGLEKMLRKVTGDRVDARAVDLAMEWGRQRPSRADAVFTALSAAVAYDHHYTEARGMGRSDMEARDFAQRQTDAVILHTAQPDSLLGKSHIENRLGTVGKGLFMFQSPNRQAFAMTYLAFKNGQYAKGWALFLQHWIITGIVVQTIGNLFRYALSDDDWDETWEAKDYAVAMALGPLTGIVVAGPLIEALAAHYAGGYEPRQPSVAATGMTTVKALEKVFTDNDYEVRDAGQLATSLGQFLGGRATALGATWNALKQILGFHDAVTPGD